MQQDSVFRIWKKQIFIWLSKLFFIPACIYSVIIWMMINILFFSTSSFLLVCNARKSDIWLTYQVWYAKDINWWGTFYNTLWKHDLLSLLFSYTIHNIIYIYCSACVVCIIMYMTLLICLWVGSATSDVLLCYTFRMFVLCWYLIFILFIHQVFLYLILLYLCLILTYYFSFNLKLFSSSLKI